MGLRINQRRAIEYSIKNNFKSGVHFHATGTGKSWIALELILEYNKKHKRNIIWLCEQKSILIQQFKRSTIKEKGYLQMYDQFDVLNYVEKKPREWYKQVNNLAKKSDKSILLIINRSFLVSQKKYQKLDLDIGLIIHDECHSIKNKTTKAFYEYMLDRYKGTSESEQSKKQLSCLGFSATPYLETKPFNKILTEYNIYDAFCDEIIVPPRISWVKSDTKFSDQDFITICKEKIKDLHYKKIIVWCGIIDKCYELSELWKKHFSDYFVAVDTSKDTNDLFETYYKKPNNAILFCACKHREGSDILNLDCCIFLDKVENRNPKTFVQCIGRVLRKDNQNKKKFGLILDLKASSCIKVCDRMSQYFNCQCFPWQYDYSYQKIKDKQYVLHDLLLINKNKDKQSDDTDLSINESGNQLNVKKITKETIKKLFVRKMPDTEKYIKRLNEELDMIQNKDLFSYLIRAIDILKMTNNIPHVTRGSCGSSLVCYLLGISNVDPVKHNISFARFLNKYRNNLPDIDFDFPHYLRDEVFLKLQLKWPNQVARISNHVYWHEKSALREAVRKIGIKKRIPKEDMHTFIKSLTKEQQKQVEKHKNELLDTFRHYSLHCGGIVFFHKGIPGKLILNKNKTLNQIIFNKEDVASTKRFKIDILSSKGISQLMDIPSNGKQLNFTDCPYDEKTYKLLRKGNNIGITLAESPLMRKALMKIKPTSIEDLALCLAIIRPAAKDARKKENYEVTFDYSESITNDIDYDAEFVYDDDAITIIAKTLNIDEDLADKYRRCISKKRWKKKDKENYDYLLSKLSKQDRRAMKNKLKNLSMYGFCRSHSYSYAQLVYKLAYQKAHNPKQFWEATLKNANSSYRKWVHLYEAYRSGVDVNQIINKERDVSLYAENRRKKFHGLGIRDQLTRYGYWDMKKYGFMPNCYFYKKGNVYYFSGLIASQRTLNWKQKIIVNLIGFGDRYIEVTTYGSYCDKKSYGLKGRCKLKSKEEKSYTAFIARYY